MNQTSHFSLEVDSSPVTRILRIFEQRKEQLRFPDVDAEILNEFQAAVHKEEETVCAMEEQLAEAHEMLVQARKDLRDRAERAHAYLQVFAAGDPELEAELAEIKWSSAERSGRKRRPLSKKKTKAKEATAPSSSKQGELVTEVAAE